MPHLLRLVHRLTHRRRYHHRRAYGFAADGVDDAAADDADDKHFAGADDGHPDADRRRSFHWIDSNDFERNSCCSADSDDDDGDCCGDAVDDGDSGSYAVAYDSSDAGAYGDFAAVSDDDDTTAAAVVWTAVPASVAPDLRSYWPMACGTMVQILVPQLTTASLQDLKQQQERKKTKKS